MKLKMSMMFASCYKVDVCKLLQSIYGLKRSYVVAHLKKNSYLYKYKSEVENSLIGVYVDNMVMGGGEKK